MVLLPQFLLASALLLAWPCGLLVVPATFLLFPEATEVLWARDLLGSVFECVCTDRCWVRLLCGCGNLSVQTGTL